jgi:hypothetical protein
VEVAFLEFAAAETDLFLFYLEDGDVLATGFCQEFFAISPEAAFYYLALGGGSFVDEFKDFIHRLRSTDYTDFTD